jgi:hypothetical protein
MRRRRIIVVLAMAALVAAGVVSGVRWMLAPRTLTVEDRRLLREGMSLADAERALGRPPDRDEKHRPVLDPVRDAPVRAAGVDPSRTAYWEATDGWNVADVDTAGRIAHVSYSTHKDLFRLPSE